MRFPPWTLMLLLLSAALLITAAQSQQPSPDAAVMFSLRDSLGVNASSLDWSGDDPCNGWTNVQCDRSSRITRIQIGGKSLKGTLPPSLSNLSQLQIFEVFQNNISGAVPSLAGLSNLQRVMLRDNQFTSMPSDFFNGMTSLQNVTLDNNKMLSPWSIPDSLKSVPSLNVFSAVSTNLEGPLPEFLFGDSFPTLQQLKLSFNNLEGGLPPSVPASSSLSVLWLNGQHGTMLNGSIAAIQNMTNLSELWLNDNMFSGPLPDFSKLQQLVAVNLKDNKFTGLVPQSFVHLPKLGSVNLTNNLLQGPTPNFTAASDVNTPNTNSFCLPNPGAQCDPIVSSLLDVARDVGYPSQFASSWKNNDPCASWIGISCDNNGKIEVVNFNKMQLTGTISPSLSNIDTLQKLLLSNNNLTGTIPTELTKLSSLKILDVSNNQLYGKVPTFPGVEVKVTGNVNIGKDPPPPPIGDQGGSSGGTSSGKKKSSTGLILGSVVGVGAAIVFAGLLVLFIRRAKRKGSSRVQAPSAVVIHPQHSGSDQDTVKITIAGPSSGGATSDNYSRGSSETSNIHFLETNGLKIQIEVLRRVTKNFSEENILGRGGFGTVYKGDLDDGTTIAVKRMESGVMNDKGLEEFQSEIAIVTKVRHRHLVALLGFCLDAGERIFVYEYMSQGALSRHLFDWKEEQLKPLEWMKRLIIALDVARGVEYLHSLAQHSFIHRDLKPANILLGDDLRAKVADFGLIRLVPDGKASVATKLAGTFGYLSPEYAVMGRVTTKLDVYSFGVILMELISGRKSLDETLPAESSHLVTWFRRVLINKELHKVVDPTIELNEETLASVHKVAELAGHCCANEPYQRPDMSHAVIVLSSLTEMWKPSETDPDDPYGIDYDMPLPQAVKKWQALEGMSSVEGSSYFGSNDNTQTSIPTRPSGFADSFTSSDGR